MENRGNMTNEESDSAELDRLNAYAKAAVPEWAVQSAYEVIDRLKAERDLLRKRLEELPGKIAEVLCTHARGFRHTIEGTEGVRRQIRALAAAAAKEKP